MEPLSHRNLRAPARVRGHVPTRRTTWRALPTAMLVVGAILLGAVTARADVPAGHAAAAASSSAATR